MMGHREGGNARNDAPLRPGPGVGRDNRWRRWDGTGRMPGSTTEDEGEIKEEVEVKENKLGNLNRTQSSYSGSGGKRMIYLGQGDTAISSQR